MQVTQYLYQTGRELLRHGTELVMQQRGDNACRIMGVLQIGDAADMIIKSVIVRANAGLMPGLQSSNGESVAVAWHRQRNALTGVTPFELLPGLLFDSTGYRISRMESFREFGNLRRFLQQLGVPPVDLGAISLTFVTDVIYPLLETFWPSSHDSIRVRALA